MTIQLHQKPRSEASLSDEYETPIELYDSLCDDYGIHPTLDVACNQQNCKTEYSLMDGLQEDWDRGDVWCNPPHSKTAQFVEKAYEQWKKHNINVIMIIPANSLCTKYAEKYIEGSAEYHPIFYRPIFLQDGKPTKFPSRNSYFVVIWRKQ